MASVINWQANVAKVDDRHPEGPHPEGLMFRVGIGCTMAAGMATVWKCIRREQLLLSEVS